MCGCGSRNVWRPCRSALAVSRSGGASPGAPGGRRDSRMGGLISTAAPEGASEPPEPKAARCGRLRLEVPRPSTTTGSRRVGAASLIALDDARSPAELKADPCGRGSRNVTRPCRSAPGVGGAQSSAALEGTSAPRSDGSPPPGAPENVRGRAEPKANTDASRNFDARRRFRSLSAPASQTGAGRGVAGGAAAGGDAAPRACAVPGAHRPHAEALGRRGVFAVGGGAPSQGRACGASARGTVAPRAARCQALGGGISM